MSYDPKTLTLDVYNTPVGECKTTGLEELSTLELSYLYVHVSRRMRQVTGRDPEDFLDGMRAMFAPA